MAPAPLTIVVGAGISGLTCAYALKKLGEHILLLESSARPGGVIQSVLESGYLFELGPQSFSSTSELAALCDELKLTEELLQAPHTAPRYILIGNRLKQVPMSPPSVITSNLLGARTKVSFLRDAFGRSTPPQEDESVGAFVRRKFSAEFLDRLVEPFVSGIYAGDPEQLSLRAAFPRLYQAERSAGSVIRGALKSGVKLTKKPITRPQPRPGLISFKRGNEALIRALANALGSALRCDANVAEIVRTEGRFQLSVQTPNGFEPLICDRLIFATPTGTTARLLQLIAPAASAALENISYASLAVVSLGYSNDQLPKPLAGFGFLAPRSSGIRMLGSVWNSSVFPHRAPEGYVLLTNFVGGATDPLAVTRSEDELVTLVHREIAPILNITAAPSIYRVTRYSNAIPQYNLGHSQRLRTIQDSIASIPGLQLIGNYWNGPSVGACIDQALTKASAKT